MGCLTLQGAVAECGREVEGLLARHQGAVEVACHHECLRQLGKDLSQPGPVVQRPGQGLGLTQERTAPPKLSAQRVCQSKAELDSQYSGIAVFGQVRESPEGLLVSDHGLAERGAVEGPRASLLAVDDGLVPHFTPQGMLDQPFGLLGHPVSGERLQGLDDAGMEHPPPFLE